MSNPETPPNIALDPVDWFLAGWRDLPPLPLPPAKPFDREECLHRLRKAKLQKTGWNWKPAAIGPSLAPAEARFWLWAMVNRSAPYRGQAIDKPPTLDQMREGFHVKQHGVGPELAPVLCAAFSLEEFLRLYFGLWPIEDRERRLSGAAFATSARRLLCIGFLRNVRPYLSRQQLQPLQAIGRPLFHDRFHKDKWVPAALADLARVLDLHEEIGMLVSSWPDGSCSALYSQGGTNPGFLLFGLGGADAVLHHLGRLAMPLANADNVRAFLAHTATSALSTIRDHILTTTTRDSAEEMTEVFSLVRTPETAPLMLELAQAGKGIVAARRWLDAHVELAVAGLLPLVGARGKLGDGALSYLRDVVRAGQTAVIDAALADAEIDLAERVRKALRSSDAPTTPPLDDDSLPEWFVQGRPPGKVQMPAWLSPLALPLITIQGRSLAPEHTIPVLSALKDSTLSAPAALVVELKKHADRASLEAFAWDLFERWLGAGAPPKDKWALSALGLLGGDGVCLRLWPLVADWPGQSQHKRAVHGLECLRAIGSEQALLQLRKLADKVKFPGLKCQAQQFMQEIADERGLTPAQLEDRIVPDLGLDEQGMRSFDYGPRQFRVALGSGFKPRVQDDSGSIRTDLPRPTAKDDAARVATAQAEWKLFKLQLKEVLKTQAERLEKAMTRRRWRVPEFEKYLIRHPLMRYLAKVLLWGRFGPDHKVAATFRVTEDGAYADVAGKWIDLDPQWEVGVVHPVLLSAEEREQWTEVFADHEILPPFPQLGRAVFQLAPAEAGETILKRFAGSRVPGMALVGATKKTGWEPGATDANYKITRHAKHFPEAGLTAFITYQPGLEPYSGYGGAEDQEFQGAYFIRGEPAARTATAESAVPLGTVDVLVLNEVAGLMLALVGKRT